MQNSHHIHIPQKQNPQPRSKKKKKERKKIEMNNQEGSEILMEQQQKKKEEEFQESVEPFDNSFSMLRLNNHKHKHNHNHHSPCTSCGCAGSKSMKRRSPSSSSPSSKSKKPFEDPNLHQGFSKILLPITTLTPSPPPQPQPQPPLRRCISDGYNLPTSNVVLGAPMTEPFVFGPNIIAPHSPEQTAKTCVNVNPSTPSSNIRLPPLPPPLRRTISDPNPSPAKNSSRSSSSKEETPNSKRLRRMKERMAEMSGWCGELMSEQLEEDEEEDGGAADNNAATKDDSGADFEESVCVEKVEDSLAVHFKCPCGKGYQILLSGNACYYKLM